MLIRYKKNKRIVCYDSDSFASGNKAKAEPRPHGPFLSCGDCTYPSHDFMCYSSKGDCLRTHMKKINQRKEKKG